MFMFDSKKDMQTIVNRRKKGDMEFGPAPMKSESVKTEDGAMDGRHLAAQDAIAAIKEGSPEKLMSAWIDFHDIHQSMRQKEQEESAAGSPPGVSGDNSPF